MKIIYFVIICNFYIIQCQNSTKLINITNSTDKNYIYSDNFREKYNSNHTFKKYLIETENKTELLYIEFKYSENKTHRIPYNDYYHLNIYWFNNYSWFDYSPNGIFYGAGLTQREGNSTFTDLKLCKYFNMLGSCLDYFLFYSNSTLSVDLQIKNNFTPLLDIAYGGQDNIYYYVPNNLITSGTSPYKSLINFFITLPTNLEENFDLELDFHYNLTILYGKFSLNETNKSEKFEIFSVITTNFSEIVYLENHYYKINFLIYILLLLTF